MEDFKELNLQDLEAVAGGKSIYEQMTAEERAENERLVRRLSQAAADFDKGKITAEERNRALRELAEFGERMKQKYA